MKAFARNPRTGLPALAVFVTLVLSFAVPPLSSVVAAGSSSGSMSSASSSPAANCDSSFNAGTVHPGDTVHGTLFLGSGCKFSGGVNVALNGKSLNKNADSNGTVSVSVKINSLTSGVLDDPVDVDLHQGGNTVIVSGSAVDSSGNDAGTATVDASFDLQPATTSTTGGTTTTLVIVPVAQQTTTGTGGSGLANTGINLLALLLLALVAIALGTYTMASERAVPVDGGAGVGSGAAAVSMSIPLLNPPAADQWTLELAVLAAVSYILGPPPGRHARQGGPRGVVPMIRDWIFPGPPDGPSGF
jgi:hypothetical protein